MSYKPPILSRTHKQQTPEILSSFYDLQAAAFFAGAQTAARYRSGLDAFVKTLKAAGIWNKCDRIWPFDPTSETASQYELKRASPDLTFVNAPVWSTQGLLTDGSTNFSYVDTGYDPSTSSIMTDNSVHLGTRLTSETIGVEGINSTLIGVKSGSIPIHRASIDVFPGVPEARGRAWSNTVGQYARNLSYDQYNGVWFMSRQNSTDIKLYDDGTQIGTSANANTGTKSTAGIRLFIASNSNDNVSETVASGIFSFATIGSGLTATEISTYTTAINTLQTAWGR